MGGGKAGKRIYRANVDGNRGRRIPQRRWRDEVEELLMGRRLSEREEMVVSRDRDVIGCDLVIGLCIDCNR